MAVYAPIRDSDGWFKGCDFIVDYYHTTTPHVKAAADVALAATAVPLAEPLEEALITGDKVRFAPEGKAGVIVTLTADAVVGATSMTVSATTGIIHGDTPGAKVQRGINTWTEQWKAQRGNDPAIITKTTGSGLTVTDEPNGVGRLTLAPADTPATIEKGGYDTSLRRTDAPNAVVLAFGDAVLQVVP